MKRLIFVLFIFLLYSRFLFSQLYGTGTSLDPYYGTVTSNITFDHSHANYSSWQFDEWGNKVIYVCRNASGYRDLIISSGVTLTLGTDLGAPIALTVQGGSSRITINSTGVFAIEPGDYVKTFSITNNGTIRLRSNSAGIPSLCIQGVYSGSGTAEETIFLTGGTTGSGGHRWHYISTPIDGVPASVFTGSTQNLARYIEPRVQSDNSAGWIAYDGYIYSTDGYDHGYDFSSLYLGQGYNYYSSSNASYTFSGTLNNSDRNLVVTRGSGSASGFNLIGNPFASVLDWDYITDIYINGIPDQVDNAIYFTVDDGIASYVGKVASGGATEYGSIPPMQGFFVYVNTPTSGVQMTLPFAACTVDPWQFRYKGDANDNGKTTSAIPLVRLKFENQRDSDDLVIRFDEKATTAFDKKFDAYKFSKTFKSLGTWSKMAAVDYSINGLPFPATNLQIPIGIYTSSAGVLKLSSNELHNLDSYSVTLKDLVTNITVDLKKGDIMVFDSPAGIIEDRFILTVSNLTTSVPELNIPDKKFSIYSSSGIVNIVSLTDEFSDVSGSVAIYDLTGRKIMQQTNLKWNGNGELKQIPLSPAEKGLFLVEIKAGNKKYVEKVNLNK